MYTNNRDAYRQTFFNAWQKYKKKLLLEPVESELVEVILLHPEYHRLLETNVNQDFPLEENPFFHMSLHLAIREQVRTDRPAGIKKIRLDLIKKYHDAHEVDHKMMQCLAQLMWNAQQSGKPADDQEYLRKLLSSL